MDADGSRVRRERAAEDAAATARAWRSIGKVRYGLRIQHARVWLKRADQRGERPPVGTALPTPLDGGWRGRGGARRCVREAAGQRSSTAESERDVRSQRNPIRGDQDDRHHGDAPLEVLDRSLDEPQLIETA